MPGHPVRACARFRMSPGDSPSRITGLPLALTAIIRRAQELSRFDESTLRHNVAPRNKKTFPACAETVDDVPSLWNPEEI